MNDLTRFIDVAQDVPRDPLFEALADLFDDHAVASAVRDLRVKIIDRLLAQPHPVQGVDFDSERLDHILDGSLNERLEKARVDLNALNIDRTGGSVEIIDDVGTAQIGRLTVPYGSGWARQSFINTNVLMDGIERFVFTPQNPNNYISPTEVTKHSTGAEFLLSDREAIAAQILLIVNTALGYRDCARACATEENPFRDLRIMKVYANLRDLHDALQYAIELKGKLQKPLDVDHSKLMIAGMSASGNLLSAE